MELVGLRTKPLCGETVVTEIADSSTSSSARSGVIHRELGQGNVNAQSDPTCLAQARQNRPG